MRLAERIRSVRKERRLSQEAAAHATGISVRAYRSLETGEAVDPHYSTLLGISRGLGVPITDLLEEAVPKAEAPSESGQTDPRTIAEEAMRRQLEQDRQAGNRALAGEGRPQVYFKKHENEALEELSKRMSSELAEALLEETQVRLETEAREAQKDKRIAELEAARA